MVSSKKLLHSQKKQLSLVEFFETNIEGLVTKDIPGAVKGLSELLKANAQNFDDVDAQLANSIRGNGGGNGGN